MLDYGFANFAHYTPTLPEPVSVPVKLGAADAVGAVLADSAPLLVNKGTLPRITARTTLLPELTAPVEAGAQLGELTVECDGQVLAVLPLVAECAVEKLTWTDLFTRLLCRVAMGQCS